VNTFKDRCRRFRGWLMLCSPKTAALKH